MAAFGSVIAAISIILVIYGLIQKRKASKLTSVPFGPSGDAAAGKGADAKGAISAFGAVHCEQTLTSPCTGTPCLYYELKVVGSWKEGDTNKTKDYIHEKVAAGFTIDDGSGPVPIDASKGGDFDGLKETFNQEKKEGIFDDLKAAVGKGKAMEFGSYAFSNPIGSKADKFRCTEKILPVTPNLFAAGKAAQGVITQPDGMFGTLYLSPQGRDELITAATAESAKYMKFGGIGFAVGVVIGLIGNFM